MPAPEPPAVAAPRPGAPLRFLVVGGAATLAQYAVFAAGTGWLGVQAAAASAVGGLLGSLVSYAFNRSFTFGSGRPHLQAVPRFYAMVAAAFVLTAVLMTALVEGLGWRPWPAQFATTGACLLFNYAVSRLWVFGRPAA